MKFSHVVFPGIFVVAGAILVGCQSATETETSPQMMSNVPSRPLEAPTLTTPMEIFDANLGDTATGTGGGGDASK